MTVEHSVGIWRNLTINFQYNQAYTAELKAQKAAIAATKLNCDEYKMDKKGRCPGDTGYVSFVKEDVPKDFAVRNLDLMTSS